jgi:hypothetical protein
LPNLLPSWIERTPYPEFHLLWANLPDFLLVLNPDLGGEKLKMLIKKKNDK